ncbi:hypothetical protein [Streptomyces sp. NPDC037389]|uniref:hypothetical protein n=1 Tax=Streptomyces sp. NPDC037389 TaxID=3155369 RepID=UPI0033C88344
MYATDLAVKALEPTPEEERLAEDYVTILGSLSAMEQAVRDGAWHRLRDEADELMSAAEEMWAGLPGADDDEAVPVQAVHVPSQADGAKIRQLIAVYAQHCALGRALYPTSLIQDAQLRRAVEEEHAEAEHPAVE